MHNQFRLMGSVAAIFLPTFVFGAFGSETQMGIALLSGALAATFLNLDQISRFSGGGINIEMKEALAKAEVTLEALSASLRPLILFNLNNLSAMRRGEGLAPEYRRKSGNDLAELVKRLALREDPDVSTAVKTLLRTLAADEYQNFFGAFAVLHGNRPGPLPPPTNWSDPLPSEDAIRRALKESASSLSTELESILAKYLDQRNKALNYFGVDS